MTLLIFASKNDSKGLCWLSNFPCAAIPAPDQIKRKLAKLFCSSVQKRLNMSKDFLIEIMSALQNHVQTQNVLFSPLQTCLQGYTKNCLIGGPKKKKLCTSGLGSFWSIIFHLLSNSHHHESNFFAAASSISTLRSTLNAS